MKDALNRRLPPLAYRNSIDRLFNTVEAPADNIAWMDSITHRLAIVTAEMNAERERAAELELQGLANDYGVVL
jgi:hypothetical protein